MGISLRVVTDYKRIPTETKANVRSLVCLKGKEPEKTTPLHISIVIDKSGSMSGEKIAKVKDAVKGILGQMADDDLISLVVFSNTAEKVFESTPVKEKEKITEYVERITVGGNTNLYEGYSLGCEILKKTDPKFQCRLLLLSDGRTNQGITNADRICGFAEKTAAGGITTSTFGVGDHFDEVLMTGISEAGGGNGYFIERPEDTAETFWEEMNFLRHITNSNCYVDFVPGEDVEDYSLMNFYRKTDKGWYIGDISSAEELKLVFEIKLKKFNDAKKANLGTVKVFDDRGSELNKTEATVSISVVDKLNMRSESPDEEVTKEAVLLSIAEALREAAKLANQRRFEDAAKLLKEYYTALMSFNVSDPEVSTRLAELKEKIGKFRYNGSGYYTEKEKKYTRYEQEMLGKRKHTQYHSLKEKKTRGRENYDDRIVVMFDKVHGVKIDSKEFSENGFATVGDFLKEVYNEIKDIVPVYSYGRRWVLRDVKTGRIPNIGSYWVRQNTRNASAEDKRSLKEAGILSGTTFEVVVGSFKPSRQPNYNNIGNTVVIFSNDPRLAGKLPMHIDYNSHMIAAEFLKDIYAKIRDIVPPYSYGRQWMLVNLTAGHIIDAGSSWAQSMGMNADIRPLSKVDIKGGDIIELVLF